MKKTYHGGLRIIKEEKKPTFFCLRPLLFSGLILQKRTKGKMWANRLINFASGTKSHSNKYNSVIQVLKFLKPLNIKKLELTKVFKNCCKETSYFLLLNLVQNIGRKMLKIQNSIRNLSLEIYWSHIWFIFVSLSSIGPNPHDIQYVKTIYFGNNVKFLRKCSNFQEL